MQQLLTEHHRLGRDDPRVVTRGQLVELGVPIAALRQAGKQKQCGIFVHFKQKLEREERVGEIGEASESDGSAEPAPKRRRRSRAEYRAWLQTVSSRFQALSELEINILKAEAKQAHADKLDRHAAGTASFGLGAGDCVIENVVTSLGEQRSPVSKEVFEATVANYIGLADDASAAPGFSAYEGLFRSMQLRDAFIEDQGAILNEDKVEYRQLSFAQICLLAAEKA